MSVLNSRNIRTLLNFVNMPLKMVVQHQTDKSSWYTSDLKTFKEKVLVGSDIYLGKSV